MNVDFRLFTGTTPRLSQYAQASATSAVNQDGGASAQLTSIGIGDGGTVVAQYSNGQQLVVGQMAMALIRNPESLLAVGNNNYQLSFRTAVPAIGLPGTGGRGAAIGGATESSNVDIAQEFTNLIVLQRGFEANSKIITAVDELSQVTINLKK
jgi:flagellar hook protein FlgE